MNAFDLHRTITQKYESYLRSFIHISDEDIRRTVEEELQDGKLVPQPLVQLNPNFKKGYSLDKLVEEEGLAPALSDIFRGYDLYTHQVEALRLGARYEGFVVTSGTGSGKSVTFLGTVFNYVLKHRQPGIKAILIYPMNALITSQFEEIEKYAKDYTAHTGMDFPIRYATYTGNTPQRDREEILANPPDVLLTNYMMLELIMTRHGERGLRTNLAAHLKYLVFDELHTYRGRQGADVSLLIRRIWAWVRRQRPSEEVLCLGTSATMATEGTLTEQKGKVAEVAEIIFGQRVTADQIIIETLEPSTQGGPLPSADQVGQAIDAGIDPAANEAVLKDHATARWLEQEVGMVEAESGVFQRAKPLPWNTLITQLAQKAEVPEEVAEKHLQELLQWAERVNQALKEAGQRRSYLGVRLHQFISQTSNVYITLEPAGQRQIKLEKERQYQHEVEVPMFPVFFSRLSGYEFVGVHAYDDGEKDGDKQWKLEPREMDQLQPQKMGTWGDGYLLIHRDGEEDLWDEKRDMELLPSSWKTSPKKKEAGIISHYRFRVPRQIYFDKWGRWSQEAKYPHRGWFVPYKFPYDPTAKVVQGGSRNENSRLMRLGNAGRSTTTSLITLEVLRSLIHAQVPPKKQKLLSFTDNRQDASLQAGHFNDFLMILRLRSALFQALRKADQHTLTLKEIAEAVCAILDLPESTYAYRWTEDGALPNRYNVEALTDYIRYRLLYDVTSGWRINLPNLEQTGLMKLGYEGLEALCRREDHWAGLRGLAGVASGERLKRLQVTLNFFRMHYALDYYQLEDKNHYDTLKEKLRQQLDPEKLWSLDHREKLRLPGYIVLEALKETKHPVQAAGKNSRLHRYWKRMWQLDAKEDDSVATEGKNQQNYEEFITELFGVLERLHLITKAMVKGKRQNRIQTVDGYQLASGRLMWTIGNGKVSHDPLRVEALAEYTPRINPFFQKLYQQDFSQYPPLWEGREHTGQVSGKEREELESRFREGELAAMYCSPTMELGIDISSLDIVHLRNVPPNPANYAQRAGRAGRSGSTALIFTFCSYHSPHDRHYFRNKSDMVSGVVRPPLIDLTNEELVRTHLQAHLLMEMELDGLRTSVTDLVDEADPVGLPVRHEILDRISQQQAEQRAAMIKALKNITQELRWQSPPPHWYSELWEATVLDGIQDSLHQSLERWRDLYRGAREQIQNGFNMQLDSATSTQVKKEGEGMQDRGHEQLRQLRGEDNQSGDQAEFYVFRYLAAEGFLPGYNFPRIPLRTQLVTGKSGKYLSRPRFLAFREFGPRNLIYHRGSKYRVERLIISEERKAFTPAKISQKTGFMALGQETHVITNDPLTGEPLGTTEQALSLSNLLQTGETQSRTYERISSEEEERTREGYKISTYFSLPSQNQWRTTILYLDQLPLINITYAPSATLTHVNHKWRISRDPVEESGYPIGTVTGNFKSKKDLEESRNKELNEDDDPVKTVKLYISDQADILYMQPVTGLGLPDPERNSVLSLMYALKRGIELEFQVESNEIAAELMGTDHNILIYESAEGSLGVLRTLVENPERLREVFHRAYEVCHFDPKTEKDTQPTWAKATYNDLLSYFNQPHHALLDRQAIKRPLERLMLANIEGKDLQDDRQERYQALNEECDGSARALALLRYLYKNGKTLPDYGRTELALSKKNAPEIDFVYFQGSEETYILCLENHSDTELKEAQNWVDSQHQMLIILNPEDDIPNWVARHADVFTTR